MLIDATQNALDRGVGFNRFVTISWELAGIDPRDSVAATGEWIRHARDWLYRYEVPLAWVWTQERGPKLGAHCHILMHVPIELSPLFGSKPRQWARKVIERRGGLYAAGTLFTRKVSLGDSPESHPEAFDASVMGRLHYLLKCTPARLEGELGMIGRGHKPWGQSALVYGKRAAVWQDRTSRFPAGHRPATKKRQTSQMI